MGGDVESGTPGRRGPAAVVIAVVLLGALVTGIGIAYGMVSASRTNGTGAAAPPAAATSPTATEPAVTPPVVTPPSATTPPATTPAGTTPAPDTAAPAPGGSPAIPADAMLRAGDLGRSAPVRVTGDEGLAALPRTEPNACTRRTAYPTDRDRLAGRVAGYATPTVPESGGIRQTIVRYRPGRAAETLAGMRRVLAACDGWRDPAAGGWTHRYRLEGQRFAGDDALLVRNADVQDGFAREWGPHIAIVRVGDVVITVWNEDGEGTSVAARAIELARTAVGRFLES